MAIRKVAAICKTTALNPDEIEFKFEITFKLGQWKKIRENLNESYAFPMSAFADSINDCVKQVEKVYYPVGEDGD